MGWLSRLFKGRRQLLESAESERAFAPDPESDFWPLAVGATNEEIYDFIRKNGVSLVRASSGEPAKLSEFKGGLLLFVTNWDTYSAKTIGALKHGVDSGSIAKFGIVFFELKADEISVAKKESWYFPNAWALAPSSADLKALVGRVPFRVFIGKDGQIERILEGKT